MTDIIDVTATTLKKLRPPKDGEDPTMWRWFMAIGLVGNAAGLALHVALACGFLTQVFPGFAKASDQKTLKEDTEVTKRQIIATRVEGLEARIFELRVSQCAAQREGKSTVVYTYRLEPLIKKYFELTDKQPSLPLCEDLK